MKERAGEKTIKCSLAQDTTVCEFVRKKNPLVGKVCCLRCNRIMAIFLRTTFPFFQKRRGNRQLRPLHNFSPGHFSLIIRVQMANGK